MSTGGKHLYEVRLELEVYVVALSETQAEMEASFAFADEWVNDAGNAAAFLIKDEKRIDAGWLDSHPYGQDPDEPEMTCAEFIAQEKARPRTDPELEDLGQTTIEALT